ncbi:alpha/beta fold hydrolase [Actinomyces mediterranea]|uniref:alpha/beta fold hydrolase n=1 Tax=Actinomyces mediterranea TaxID=1871028 RepID=UPI00196881DA|nr:alpha/beta hydrolase [Actinomyces mediterranea]
MRIGTSSGRAQTPPRRGRRSLRIGGAILVVLVIVAGAGLSIYRHHNLHFDDGRMDAVRDAGFVEKQARTPEGTILNYAEGPDNGPALLLLHGQQVAWEDYYAVLPKLAADHRVFAVDYYGHGDSTHDPTLYTGRRIGDDLLWFTRSVIDEPLLVSGHSSGGILAALVAAGAPDLVTGVVLEDPPFFSVTPEEMREGAGTFVWKDAFHVIHDFRAQNAETDYPAYYMGHSYLTSLFGTGLQSRLVEWTKERRRTHPGEPLKLDWVPPSLIAALYHIDSYDLAFGEAFYEGSWMSGIDQNELLASIQAPSVYLKAKTHYGKDGTLFAANTDEDSDRVMRLLPHATRTVINSGHDIHVEQPTAFIEAIRSLPH